MRPSLAVQNVAHSHRVNAEKFAQLNRTAKRRHCPYQVDTAAVKPRRARAFPANLCAVHGGICRIFTRRSPAQIQEVVVLAAPIVVAGIHATRTRPYKGKKNGVMHTNRLHASSHKVRIPMVADSALEFASFVCAPHKPARTALNTHAPINGSDGAAAADLVAREAGDVSPLMGDNRFSHEALHLLIGQRPVAIRSRSRASLF